jgi:hypothetical protein
LSEQRNVIHTTERETDRREQNKKKRMSTLSSNYQNSSQGENQAAKGLSSSPNVIMSISSFVQRMLGYNNNVKPTKRTLSEEAECGAPDSLAEWVKNGANVNEIDAYGYTPLVNASLRYVIGTSVRLCDFKST